jgi:hypothetical protein
MIPLIDAGDFPDEVVKWCENNDIWTHDSDHIRYIEDDSPLGKWLASKGFEFGKNGNYEHEILVAIKGT